MTQFQIELFSEIRCSRCDSVYHDRKPWMHWQSLISPDVFHFCSCNSATHIATLATHQQFLTEWLLTDMAELLIKIRIYYLWRKSEFKRKIQIVTEKHWYTLQVKWVNNLFQFQLASPKVNLFLKSRHKLQVVMGCWRIKRGQSSSKGLPRSHLDLVSKKSWSRHRWRREENSNSSLGWSHIGNLLRDLLPGSPRAPGTRNAQLERQKGRNH